MGGIVSKFATLFLLAGALSAAAGPLTVNVDCGPAAGPVSPRLYGLMTEEINHSYDGGLYAELVRNRAFLDDAERPLHWSAVAATPAAVALSLDRDQPPSAAIPVSLKLSVSGLPPGAWAGVANEGYWGIPIRPRTRYRASFYGRTSAGSPVNVRLALEDSGGTVQWATAQTALTAEWKKYEFELTTGDVSETAQARLTLELDRSGAAWFSLVSLFPPTWNDRPNGLRIDLMQKLVDLHPKFLRFPGGNYVEGNTIAERFDWKKTVGPLIDRPGHPSPWGYRSTDGLGLLEFLEWCEDMKAEPVLAVFAGYALDGEVVPAGPGLDRFVRDALDEIEYVTGGPDTVWGSQRVRDGHPEPFPLHFVEIGNEDFFDKSNSYNGRFTQFYDAIKRRHPELQCISTVPHTEPAAKRVLDRTPDLLDEHYYASHDSFLKMAAGLYDDYDRHAPKVFVGEWASYETAFPPWDHRSDREPPTPSFWSALSDAAFMSELERNSDVVVMHCYAPLFVNVNPGARQWRPDLIGYDALRSYGSPSYYAIQLYSRHVGDERLRLGGDALQLYASATREAASGRVFLKLVNSDAEAKPVRLNFSGANFASAAVLTLAGAPSDTNSMADPEQVIPRAGSLNFTAGAADYVLPPCTIAVVTLTPASR